MGVVPADDFPVSAGCEDEFWVGFAPIHGVDAFGVALVDHDYWSFLVPQVPNLELVALLVVEGHCDLRGNVLAPANHHVPASCRGRGVAPEVEYRGIGLDIPQSNQTVF